MRQTLLELVQQILNRCDSDNVNTIGETQEGLDVAGVIKETYYHLLTLLEYPNHEGLISLTATNVNTPTHMKIPNEVISIQWVKYNDEEDHTVDLNYREVVYLDPSDFIKRSVGFDQSSSGVTRVTDPSSNKALLIENNKVPSFYTSFDENYIVFDSYDSSGDGFLQSAKVMVYGYTLPTWSNTDSFIPDLSAEHFPLLLSESLSVVAREIYQRPSLKTEQRSRQQLLSHFNNKSKLEETNIIGRPNYGRSRRK
tara:strand:- start:3517 stop:4278 length:762 start_codon:yes stop_codon:yes gene_type:complete